MRWRRVVARSDSAASQTFFLQVFQDLYPSVASVAPPPAVRLAVAVAVAADLLH